MHRLSAASTSRSPGRQGGALGQASQDADLVAQGQEFDVARRGATRSDQREIDEQPDDRVHERRQQRHPSRRQTRRTPTDQFARRRANTCTGHP
jgi:hypothetical protein